MTKFSENLRRIRKERGYTMDALAEMLGTTKQVLSRYESGERVPKITVAKNIADVLHVSLAELTGTEEPSNGNDIWQIREDFRRNPDLRAIFDLSRNATPEQMKQIKKVIKALRGTDEDTD